MALRSKSFRGDPKLERAAVADPAHIQQGDRGPHVSKIQTALNQLDHAALKVDGIYGPATAAAVRAFKQKRNILNSGGKIDDIVGIKTMAALDREMSGQHPTTFGCILPSRSKTVRLGLVGDAPPKPSDPEEDRKIMQQAFTESRQTTQQAAKAIRRLVNQIDLQPRTGRPAILDAENERVFVIASKWLNLPTDPFAAAIFIRTALGLMERSLALRTSTGGDLPLERQFATFIAGTSEDLTGVPQPDAGLRFGNPFFDQHGPLCRRHAVTHELFHLVGAHHGGQPPHVHTDLKAVRTVQQALDSAENLAELVAELTAPGGKTESCDRDGE